MSDDARTAEPRPVEETWPGTTEVETPEPAPPPLDAASETPSDAVSQGVREPGAEDAAGSDLEATQEPAVGEHPHETPKQRSVFRRGGEKRQKAAKDKRVKKLVGLKIGSSQLAAAQVLNNGAPQVVQAVRSPLEPGIVVAGEIRDSDALGAALRRFFEKHKLPRRGVRLGIGNNRVGVRIFEIEGVEEQQQLENAVRFRAEEVLPIPPDQAVLDYVVLDASVRPDGTAVRRILLVVAYREVVDRYLEACRAAGIDVVGVDLEAFALLRSLAPPGVREESAGALVGVGIGHDRTIIAVSDGRHCEFTRVLDWGGGFLNVAIARELDRAPSEVEEIKRQLSFAEDREVEGLTAEQVRKARDAVQRALAALARELVASLHFYQAQPGALGIGEVVVTGGAAHMAGFHEALGRLIGVPVKLGDPFVRVISRPQVSEVEDPGSLAVAIGLGIED